MPELPQAQDQAGPAAGKVPIGMLAGLARRTATARAEPQVGAVVSAAVQPETFSAADKCGLMAACRHEVPDCSGRRCALCKKSWYFVAFAFQVYQICVDTHHWCP